MQPLKLIENNSMFDTLQFTKRAISAGFSQRQAEFQAEEMAIIINETLVTKLFLKQELSGLESRLQSFQFKMAWTLLGGVATIIGIMQALIHFT